eukprot:COSAG05_NODE_1866_length_3934_cov_1.989048_3_plen_71_part_00
MSILALVGADDGDSTDHQNQQQQWAHRSDQSGTGAEEGAGFQLSDFTSAEGAGYHLLLAHAPGVRLPCLY